MKKSVVMLIAIIYVAAIALVSFYGLKYKMFDEVVYTTQVEILNEGKKHNDVWGDYVMVKPDPDGIWRYQIEYRVHPDNATNTGVDFVVDSENMSATVDDNGVVIFTEPDVFKVTLVAADQSGASASITIVALVQ